MHTLLIGLVCLPLVARASTFKEDINLPNLELSGQLLYQIIASEVALQNRNPSLAFQTYMAMARDTKDPRLAQRAFEIADNVQAYQEALQATQLWLDLAPESLSARSSDTLVKIRMGELTPENQKIIASLLAQTMNEQGREQLLYQTIVQTNIGAQQPSLAMSFVQPLLSDNDSRGLIALAMAKLSRQVGNTRQAQHYARRAYQDLPDNSSALLEYADTLTKNDLNLAIATIEAFIAKHPQNLDAHLGLAKAYAKNKNAKKTKTQIEFLERNEPENPSLIFTLASIADAASLHEETQHLLLKFEKLAQHNQDFADKLPQTHFALGVSEYRQKRYARAIEYFRQVPPKTDWYVDAKILQAHCLASLDDTSGAIKLLDMVTDSKKQAEIWETQARFAIRLNREKDCYRYLVKALDLKPNDFSLLYQTAIAAEKIGKFSQAENLLEKGIKLFPNKPDFYNALGYMWTTQQENLGKAKRLLDKALKIAPNDPAILDSMGWYYFQTKEYELAEEFLLKAKEKSSDKEIWLHLAELYHVQGKTKETKELLHTLSRLYTNDEMIKQFIKRFNLVF